MKANLHKQRGAALLAFTVALAIVTFTIVMAYSISSAKHQVAALDENQAAYMTDVRQKLTAAYAAHSLTIDSDGGWSTLTEGKQVLALAGIVPRWGLEAQISKPILREGVKYRVIAAYLPYEADDPSAEQPPQLNPDDGTFKPCPANTSDCLNRIKYVVVGDGFAIQRENAKKALAQLEQLTLNAQAFFKAKTMLDPEHNVSVNYFRPPYGGCNPIAEQLPCLDAPAPIFGVNPAIRQGNTEQSMAELLGLPNAPVLNPWGLPVEACNGPFCLDTATGKVVNWEPALGPPYSMVFLTRTPWGGVYRLYAVQQL
jgi:hypothetical protein